MVFRELMQDKGSVLFDEEWRQGMESVGRGLMRGERQGCDCKIKSGLITAFTT